MKSIPTDYKQQTAYIFELTENSNFSELERVLLSDEYNDFEELREFKKYWQTLDKPVTFHNIEVAGTIYKIILRKDPDGYFVLVPAIDSATQGENEADALYMAEDLIKCVLDI